MNAGKREEAATHPLIGSTLRDTYRVVRLIDRGGMGLVFEAEHLRLKRPVAVKVLSHALVRDQHALARFRAEAEIVALLQHPHVVQVIDFDVTNRQEPYIVMELLEGETLAARLERDPGLPLRFVVRVATQAASALNAVHEAGIVHRDLKPGNIFLAEMASEGVWVKLLDFGISKRTEGGQGLTGEHAIMGTPDYMSPEQALGHAASADHRSDQYSLAVIVYEMLSGRVPFLGNSEIEILSQVVSLQAPPLRELAPGVPEELSRVIERAMSKLPADRFASMDDFALALAQAGGVSLPPPLSNDGRTLRLTSDPAVLSPESIRATVKRTNSGLRERTPSRKAATLAGLSPRAALLGLLGRFERAYAHKNLERAAELVEQALNAAETTTEPDVGTALASTRPMMLEILEAHLAPLERRIRRTDAQGHDGRLSPQEAFLLANAEQRYSIEELVDGSPVPRLETLRIVARLLRAGLLIRAE